MDNKNNAQRLLCSGCECVITDKYYLRTDEHVWHGSCLKCDICEQSLDKTNSCYKRNGTFYCQHDYFRIYQQRKCAKCQEHIEHKEMVMKVLNSVFHIHCFICGVCGKRLNSGEYFLFNGNILFCQDEIRKSSISTIFSGIQSDFRLGLQNNQSLFESIFSKSKPRKPIGVLDDEVQLNISPRHQDFVMMGISKQKRLRTSFKHHQVRVMRTYFSLNHNPDTKDLKTLSEKTGLSKRVLQVWFQNARAKFRRSGLSKSDTNSQTNEDILDSTLSYSDDTSSQEVINKENESDER